LTRESPPLSQGFRTSFRGFIAAVAHCVANPGKTRVRVLPRSVPDRQRYCGYRTVHCCAQGLLSLQLVATCEHNTWSSSNRRSATRVLRAVAPCAVLHLVRLCCWLYKLGKVPPLDAVCCLVTFRAISAPDFIYEPTCTCLACACGITPLCPTSLRQTRCHSCSSSLTALSFPSSAHTSTKSLTQQLHYYLIILQENSPDHNFWLRQQLDLGPIFGASRASTYLAAAADRSAPVDWVLSR